MSCVRSDAAAGRDRCIDAVVTRLRAARAAGRRGVALIDGRSGAGKSTVAAEIAAEAATVMPLRLLHLDAWYPGWDGLAAGSRILAQDVLGESSCYRAWDWEADRPGEVVRVDPQVPLVVEGCGALTADSVRYADVTVWVDAAADIRKERALRRDGDMFAPHWAAWAHQEDAHIARHNPAALADLRLDTTTSAGTLTCRRP